MKLILNLANGRSHTEGCSLQESWSQSGRGTHFTEAGLGPKSSAGPRQSCMVLVPHWLAVLNEVGPDDTPFKLLLKFQC